MVGSDINLAAAEVELAGVVGREVILRDLLGPEEGQFDFILMDCAPSLGVLTLNALAAATEVFIPLQPHFLALHGLGKLLETTALVARRINPGLRVSGIVLCLYEANIRLTQEVIKDLEAYLEKGRGGNVPWSQARRPCHPDSAEHQAGGMPEFRPVDLRLCRRLSWGRGLCSAGPGSVRRQGKGVRRACHHRGWFPDQPWPAAGSRRKEIARLP